MRHWYEVVSVAFYTGEEIISGAQRVHVPELLETLAKACGIDVKTIRKLSDFCYTNILCVANRSGKLSDFVVGIGAEH